MRGGMVSIIALLAAVPALAADISGTNSGATVPGAGDTVQSGVSVTNSSATGSAALTITSGSSGSPRYFYNFGTVQSALGSSQSAIGANGNDWINITNNAGGVIEALGSGDAIRLDQNITLSNSGTIHSVGGAEAIRLNTGASVTNLGTIQGDLSPTSGNNSNTLRVNSGTIVNGSLANDTALILNTGSATNFSGADQDSNVYALAIGEGGVVNVTNYGIIRATGDAASAETGHNEGEVGAVRMRGDNNTLTNYGTIETTGHILVSPDTNSNAADDTQEIGDMYGIRIDANGDSVDNYGTITGGKHGITVDKDASNATVTNELGGVITGQNGSGVGSDATTGTVTVNNYGTITGTWNQAAYNAGYLAYSFGDGDGVDIDHLAIVNNYGTIQGTGANGIKPGETSPSKSEGLAIGGGTVVNGDTSHTSALISGADYGITVDDSNGGDAFGATSVTNYGTIRGLNGYAIKLVNSAGSFGNTIVNYGTISGTAATTVLMGNGADTFDNFGGSVTGIVDAEGGADTLNIDRGASSSFALVGGDWLNFETTNVKSGTVTLTGDFTSSTAFNVYAGSSFIGSSTVTTGLFDNAGTVGTGTSTTTGTLTVAGAYTNESTGAYAAKLDGSGHSDLIHATGAAALDGKLVVSSIDPYIQWSKTYTLLQSGGLGGTFATFDTTGLAPSSYWTPTLHYGASDLTMTFVSTGKTYATVATGLTPAGAAAAAALFAAHDNATEPMKSLLGEIDALDASSPTDMAELGQGLNQLAPDASDAGFAFAENAALLFSGELGDRIGALQSSAAAAQGRTRLALSGNSSGDLTASLMGGASLRQAASAGLWGRAYGLTGDVDADAGAANGYSYKGGGFEGGYDTFLSDNALAGVAFGYGRGLTDPDRTGASADVTSYTAALYAGVLLGNADLSAKLAYGWNDFHSSRYISLVGATAAADYDGSTVSGNVEAGYTLALGNIALRPAASLDWVHLETDAFTETGATGFNLSQASRSDDLVRSALGASAALTGGPVVPSLGLRWGHDLSQADQAIDWSFAGLAGSAFTTVPNTVSKDALLVDLGLDAKPAEGLDLSLAGSADLRSDARSYGLSARLRYSW